MAAERPTPAGPLSPDLTIVESRVYRGPNVWSYEKSIHLVVDLGVMESYPTDRIPGFTDRLMELLPGLERHACSRGHSGGSSSAFGRAPGWATWPSTSPFSCRRRPATTIAGARPGEFGAERVVRAIHLSRLRFVRAYRARVVWRGGGPS